MCRQFPLSPAARQDCRRPPNDNLELRKSEKEDAAGNLG